MRIQCLSPPLLALLQAARPFDSQKITSISLAPLLILSTLSIIGLNNAPAASATFPGENGKIAFVSDRDGNSEIYVMSADGSDQTRLTTNPANETGPTWSPDGTRIAFESDRDGNNEIYVMNADGTGQTNLTRNPSVDGDAGWSPDGTKIIFDTNRDGNSEIYVMNADGSGATNLTNNTASDYSPSFSPDDKKKIVFSSNLDFSDVREIFVMNSDGTNVTKPFDIRTLPGPANARDPAWSPDGSKISFTHVVCQRYCYDEILIMNANGTNIASIAQNNPYDFAPRKWSPDGTRIVFADIAGDTTNPFESHARDTEIFLVNSDATGKIRLTNNTALDTEPDWSPIPSIHQAHLTTNTVDSVGNTVGGIWTTIRSANGTLLKSGFTPLSFTGTSGTEYKVSVANYDSKVFSKWQDDNSISKSRIVNLTSNTTLTAIYNTGNALRGFTSLTYTGTAEQPDLTINALAIDGNKTLHMWMIIDPQSTNSFGTTYKVYATNGYQNLKFDHWSDNGSTDRVRTLTIEEATIITAYYRTG